MTIRHQFRSRLELKSIEGFPYQIKLESENLKNFFAGLDIDFVRIFQFDAEIYLYFESEKNIPTFEWPSPLRTLFDKWPSEAGLRSSVAMMDIFYDAMPRQSEAWRTVDAKRESIGSVIYLRPEKYASYVFYHFQLQEEGIKKFNKYFIIGSNENLLFSYHELPAVIDTYSSDKILSTNHSPDAWAELMAEHFSPWSEGLNVDAPWKIMKTIFEMGEN
jgi:hypothetical protein